MKILDIDDKKPRAATAIKLATGIVAALSFVFANAYKVQGAYYSLAYSLGREPGINTYIVVALGGLLFFGIYYLISHFLYGSLTATCAAMSRNLGKAAFSKNNYRINLDIAYTIGNIVMGGISLLFYFYPNAYTVGRFFVGSAAVLVSFAVFYLLMLPKMEKTYRIPLLAGMAFPFVILLILA